jgi:hypothetical protein
MKNVGCGALVASCAWLTCACVETYDGNGTLAEETRAVTGFDRVLSRGVLDLTVTQADAFGLTVRIDSNLLERVVTSVSARTLVVEIDGGNLGGHLPGPHVIVSMPTLSDAELIGSGLLSIEGFSEDAPVSVELVGSGELTWSGDASDVEALLRGSGKLVLAGSTSSADLQVGGSGQLDARALTAQSASIDLDGPGIISATVDGRVDARAAGGGVVELYGDVIEGTWEESDGGTVTTEAPLEGR